MFITSFNLCELDLENKIIYEGRQAIKLALSVLPGGKKQNEAVTWWLQTSGSGQEATRKQQEPEASHSTVLAHGKLCPLRSHSKVLAHRKLCPVRSHSTVLAHKKLCPVCSHSTVLAHGKLCPVHSTCYYLEHIKDCVTAEEMRDTGAQRACGLCVRCKACSMVYLDLNSA